MNRHVVDTGPLVAYLNVRDAHHAWAVDLFETLPAPLLTCEPVLTEAAHLLRSARGGADAVMALVQGGNLVPAFRVADEATAVRRLMARYASVPMSLADACLVRMTELDGQLRVVTVDGDFGVYRRHGRQVIPVVAP